ncbi:MULTISPECIES: SGNH/GDSL hydrolase family protein [unclassified Pseudonocardia]|uniref:SGNH/GDSL hydrolase family protein n=1 Tax=unclassified Pseudonocardia TaxID=2619320 RepID=UPI001AC082D6|nr:MULTISPECIES: SGNH/GDSL hydrolase family protein [unclassified Pseudonocardia]MBN9098102.1 SGNH/GDSL hydrolase family protein [Pseudonocardia sp.]
MKSGTWSRVAGRLPPTRTALLVALVVVLAGGGLALVRPATAAVAVPGHPVPTAAAAEPVLAVIGASIAAGVGAAGPHGGWPYLLGRAEGWRVVVVADPGAGFINPGAHHLGPFSRLLGRLDLARLDPAMVIVQGGYNDVGRPPGAVASQVAALFGAIRRAAPHARLGLVSVFSTRAGPTPAAVALDRTIIGAARSADGAVVVFDPLGERWTFPRIRDGLHPTPSGHAWIAARIAQDLRR